MLASGALGQELIREHVGPATGGEFGRALVALADLDGDGVREYAVSDPGWIESSQTQAHAGTVDVFSGATGATLFTIQGSGSGSFGRELCDAGDADGDGTSDLLVGDPLFDDPSQPFYGEGVIRAYSGRDGALIRELFGASDGRLLGRFVAALDDVDGDGVPDIFVDGEPTDDVPPRTHAAISGTSAAVLYEVPGGDLYVVGSDRDGDGLRDILAVTIWDLFAFSGASGLEIDYLQLRTGVPDGFHLTVFAEGGDLDGDGAKEVFLGIADGGWWGCERSGFGVVSFESGGWERGSNGWWTDVLPDIDGDGIDDYVTSDDTWCEDSWWTVCSGRTSEVLYRGVDVGGDSSFRPIRSVGDLDGDGRADFARAHSRYTDSSGVQRGIVRVHAGNDLWLWAKNRDPSPFEDVTLTARGVPAGNLVGIAAVDYSGTPLFLWLALGPADATEALVLSGTVPWGLSGNTATFQAFAIGRTGRVVDSARETIVFE
jgi:hypothetical protein